MHWEDKDKLPPPIRIEDSELPPELLTGLGEICPKGKIAYVRLRVWPVGGINYIKKNNLFVEDAEALSVRERVPTIARELTAAARHYWSNEEEPIEPKFEAQVVWTKTGETKLAPERSISFRLRTTATSVPAPTKRASMVETLKEIAAVAEVNPMMAIVMLQAHMHDRETAFIEGVMIRAEERERRQEGRIDSLFALELGHVDTILLRGQELTDRGMMAWGAAVEDKFQRDQAELEKVKAEMRGKGFETAVDGFKSVASDLISAAFPRSKETPQTPPRPTASPAASPPPKPTSPKPPIQTEPQPQPGPDPTMTSESDKAKQLIDLGRRLIAMEADIAILERYSPAAAEQVRSIDPNNIDPAAMGTVIEVVLAELKPASMAGRVALVQLHNELSAQAVEVIHDLMQLHGAQSAE